MDIKHNVTYDSLTYNNDGTPIWIIQGFNMSGDYIAGSLAALVSTLTAGKTNMSVKLTQGNNMLTINLDRNSYLSAMKEYYIMSSSEDKVNEDTRLPISDKFSGWWIKVQYIDNLDLYTFSTDDFIKGFIYMCNTVLYEDFREMIYGAPFVYDNRYKFITIEGYDTPPMQKKKNKGADLYLISDLN